MYRNQTEMKHYKMSSAKVVDVAYTWDRLLEFIRIGKGIDPCRNAVAGGGPSEEQWEENRGGSRPSPTKSQLTYHKHPELSQDHYLAVQTLMANKDAVVRILTKTKRTEHEDGSVTESVVIDGLEAIWQEDQNADGNRYKMPRHIERFLNEERGAVWQIGRLCHFWIKPECPQCGEKNVGDPKWVQRKARSGEVPQCWRCGYVFEVAEKEKKTERRTFRLDPMTAQIADDRGAEFVRSAIIEKEQREVKE